MITVIGGTYWECRKDTNETELYGSGLRAACALSKVDSELKIFFSSSIGKTDFNYAQSICNTYEIEFNFNQIDETVEFIYNHPLDLEAFRPTNVFQNPIQLKTLKADNIIYYGMIEAVASVQGNHVVYDPQNGKSFRSTGSTAEHLALVLNKNEAYEISLLSRSVDLQHVGYHLLSQENADIVIIKNGVHGALVIDKSGVSSVPIYHAESINPIGSGDIFTAAFAWQWISEKKTPFEAANLASQYTAQYCQDRHLPLSRCPLNTTPISAKTSKNIYLAGPFFNTAEKWLVNELRRLLLELGLNVFSPLHDVGLNGTAEYIALQDLVGLKECDTILAVADGADPGTHFEIGFAKALNKEVVVLSTNESNDLLMLQGTNCVITKDISTAVYKASW